MTATYLRAGLAPGEAEDAIRQMVALIAQACHEADTERRRAAVKRRRVIAERRAASNRMREAAQGLAAAVHCADQAGINRHLSRPRDEKDWRNLSQILAGAAQESQVRKAAS